MTTPGASQVLRLYRDLLQYGKQLQLTDKDFFRRRIRREFKKNKNIEKEEDIQFQYEFVILKPRNVMPRHVAYIEWLLMSGLLRSKHTVDYSKVPTLNEEDLDEMFVRGSGPGGQAVNKTSNCVVLTHKPTGVVVKCHESRLQEQNRQQARKLLITKLDGLINGEHSVNAQLRVVEQRKTAEKSRRQRKLEDMKNKWKTREGLQ